ncbi:ribonuclease Z [Psychrobacter glacincola]|uniref:ribonuclease Z n=1 Tax=Psychrobacter glacincola TaxID=56810 RepID=UPI0039B043D6
MLKLTFLGTSAGVPTKQRNVTALAIECLNPYSSGKNQQQNKKSRPWVLIDCGEGTQHQLLHTKLSLNQLQAICITHVHGDHCYGLPGLLASAAMSGHREPLTLIVPKAIEVLLEAMTLTTELCFPFVINFMAIEEVLAEPDNHNKISLDLSNEHQLGIDITALSHRVASYGFGITQIISRRTLSTDKLTADNIPAGELWGKLQQGQDVTTDDGRKLRSVNYTDNDRQHTRVVVAGDNDTPERLKAAVVGADLLVHEATYTSDVLVKIQTKNPDFDPMHTSAQLLGRFAEDVGLKNLIMTHFSARYQSFDNPNSRIRNMSHIRLDAESVYTGNLWLAHDFAQYLVNGAAEEVSNNIDNRVQYLGSARDH